VQPRRCVRVYQDLERAKPGRSVALLLAEEPGPPAEIANLVEPACLRDGGVGADMVFDGVIDQTEDQRVARAAPVGAREISLQAETGDFKNVGSPRRRPVAEMRIQTVEDMRPLGRQQPGGSEVAAIPIRQHEISAMHVVELIDFVAPGENWYVPAEQVDKYAFAGLEHAAQCDCVQRRRRVLQDVQHAPAPRLEEQDRAKNPSVLFPFRVLLAAEYVCKTERSVEQCPDCE
jgi:hypothetical protein